MGSMRIRWLVGSCLIVLLIVSTPSSAGAEPVADITVTPSVGLVDGQTVTVEGSGFASSGSLTVGLCPADVLSDIGSAASRCGATTAFPVPVDTAGQFVTELQVFRSQPVFLGVGTLDCVAAPDACVVLALEVIGAPPAPEVITATEPVTFRPESRPDCKRGRWRNFTDDRGRLFGNQGECLRFLALSDDSH
jgi:Neocarzinostatin family